MKINFKEKPSIPQRSASPLALGSTVEQDEVCMVDLTPTLSSGPPSGASGDQVWSSPLQQPLLDGQEPDQVDQSTRASAENSGGCVQVIVPAGLASLAGSATRFPRPIWFDALVAQLGLPMLAGIIDLCIRSVFAKVLKSIKRIGKGFRWLDLTFRKFVTVGYEFQKWTPSDGSSRDPACEWYCHYFVFIAKVFIDYCVIGVMCNVIYNAWVEKRSA